MKPLQLRSRLRSFDIFNSFLLRFDGFLSKIYKTYLKTALNALYDTEQNMISMLRITVSVTYIFVLFA